MTIKLVLHVSPLVITPHYKAQGLFLITLDVKSAVLCMRGTNESCFPAIWGPALLHFSIPSYSVKPLHCKFFLVVPPRCPWSPSPPTPLQTGTTPAAAPGCYCPIPHYQLNHSPTENHRKHLKFWKIKSEKIPVQLLRGSKVLLIKDWN